MFDVGGRGDKSFNDAAYAGLERAQKELGVTFTTLETGEGSDREAQMRQLAAGGSQLVFGVGFLFSDDIYGLAQEFPNVKFACIDYTVKEGQTLPPNLTALEFKEHEGSFLVGALAALLTKTGKVGFVGGMEIPLIKKFEAGYRAGALAANPKVEVLVKYAGTTGTFSARGGAGGAGSSNYGGGGGGGRIAVVYDTDTLQFDHRRKEQAESFRVLCCRNP